MDYYGYAGSILHVNLSTGETRKEPLDVESAKRLVGGLGINYKLAYDLITPGIDPLSPENSIILGTGLLVGTLAPGSSKLFATTKFPLNGTISTAAAGGSLGHMLKWAGYDYLVINGRSEKPVYLKILDENVEIHDASHLWGKDIFETTDRLRDDHGRECSVAAIGQAGENLGKLSFSIVDKVASLGKGGLGAVMGSKNLKAIVARGTKGLKVAELKRFRKMATEILEGVKNYPHRERWMKQGTMYAWQSFPDVTVPCNYGTTLYPPGKANELYGIKILERVKKAYVACPSCPIGCKSVIEAKDGDYAGLEAHISHFDGAAVAWGVAFDLGDYSRGIKLSDLANRYGIDELAASDIINFAINLYERGIITGKQTLGLELRRDFDLAQGLLEQMARKEGLGAILADGYPAAIKAFGKDAEKYALQIKGFYIVFDPRMVFNTEAFTQIVNPRGGAHTVPALGPTIVPGRSPEQLKRHCVRIGVPEEAMERIFDPSGFNVARFTRYLEDWYSVFNIVGICSRHAVAMHYNAERLVELVSAATGVEISPTELLKAGERIWNMERIVNIREGFWRKDDSLPQRWFEPIKVGEMEMGLMDYYRQRSLTREDMEKLLDDYYKERGWDVEKGIPTEEKLAELGLEGMT